MKDTHDQNDDAPRIIVRIEITERARDNIDRDTTAPLPLIGLSADFFITPRWTVSVFGQGMKFKVGGLTPEEDAARFRIARTAAGPDFVLFADANQGWTPTAKKRSPVISGAPSHGSVRRSYTECGNRTEATPPPPASTKPQA